MINKEDRTCEKCENIYTSYAFPFKNIDLCLFCYEEDRHTRLHKFRSGLSNNELNKYRNKYFKKQEPVINFQKESSVKTNKNTQSSKTQEEIVLEIVKYYPGLTGQEIAKKAFQNYLVTYNILIDKLKGRCYKDENYGWHLLGQSGLAKKTKISLKTRILKIIEESNGIKAKDIATKLGIERSIVNSLLYGSLKGQCKIDNAFLWRLKDENTKENNTTRTNSQTNREIIEIAVKEHREATISYKGFSRTIHPYNVNSTYCVAYCTYRNDLRTFRLDRMENVKLGEIFSVNSAFINMSDSQIENAKNFRRYY